MSHSSTPDQDPVLQRLDHLIADVQATFRTLLLAETTLRLGGNALDAIQDDSVVEATLGVTLRIEPIPIGELRQYSAVLPIFLLEVFHGKLVQQIQDCLTDIFCHYLDLHLAGVRPFVELKGQDVRIDFSSSDPLKQQVATSLSRDFAFREYADRQKLVNRVRNAAGRYPECFVNIQKHVLIRNAVQHRHGQVDDYILKKLGTSKIELLDADATVRVLAAGDKIELSIPEIDSFRRSLLLAAQAWGHD